MATPALLSNELAERRKKVVVVGLGMVGIAFIEKLITKGKRRREHDIVVLGEENHVAYNRVGLTSFFSIYYNFFSTDYSSSFSSKSIS